MAHLLYIDSSARITGSISRQLTAEFAARWRADHPDGLVTYRDLVTDPLPHIREATVAALCIPPAACTPEQARATALQEELVAELAAADTLLIGAPMYSFRIPSSLKAWIDHVAPFGRIACGGLFADTRVVIASARGVHAPGTRRQASTYQERHLSSILGLIGSTDISFVHATVRAAVDGDLSPAQMRAAAEPGRPWPPTGQLDGRRGSDSRELRAQPAGIRSREGAKNRDEQDAGKCPDRHATNL